MNIFDISYEPIERVETSSWEEVLHLMETARYPIIFTGLNEDLAFLNSWDLDYLKKMNTEVPVQKPEADGVNYFIRYERTPMAEVVERIRRGDGIYIGAKQITGAKGVRTDIDGLGSLSDAMTIPKWIDKNRIRNANFWLGAGNNNTLLHYDAWDSVLLLGQGKKEFIVFPSSESPRMFQYSALNFKSLVDGRVLHSRIRPLDIQKRYQSAFKQAKGQSGTVHAGEVMFVPGGFWHFVQSTGTNIAVNFFIHTKDRAIHWHEPLRTYWLKDNITLWPVRWYWKSKYRAARVFRHFFPKKPAQQG